MKFLREKLQNVFAMSPMFEVIRDSSIYGITRIIGALIGLITIPIFAQIMSPDLFGLYSLALLTVTISYQVVNEWSRSSILRFDSKYSGTNEYDRYISSIFITPILIGVVVGSAVIGLWLTTDLFNEYSNYVLAGVGVFILSIVHSMLITLLRVRHKAKKFSTLQLLNRFAALAIGIGLILWLKIGGEGLLYGTLVTLAVLIPISVKWTGILGNISFRYVKLSDLKRYFSYGIPLTFFALSAFFMRYTDRYMISIFRGVDEVGLYSFACLLPQRTIEMIIGIIALGAYPIIVREWENTSSKAATDITSGLTRYHLLITAPIVILLLILPKQIISFVGTTNYEVAYRAIPFVTIATYFTSIAWFSSIAFHLSTRTGQLLLISVCSLLVNFILNLITVQKWGFLGAAFATMITSILYFSAVFIVSRKWLPWRISGKVLMHVLVAGIISGSIALLLKSILPDNNISFLSVILVYILSYLSILELEGEFKLSRIIRRLF